ncbi:MAG: hypothetical protein RLP09_17380 [Sandaracinaceae bacterium]
MVLLSACGSESGLDASAAPDARAVVDGSMQGLDAGRSDAGPIDAGRTDAGLVDAALMDAALMDAGLTDSGFADAGLADAGFDAGPSFGYPCDLVVPDDHATIPDAVAAAPSPGVVCVRAGIHDAAFSLRPHVAVVGEGPATIIRGEITARDLDDPDPTPTLLADFTLEATGNEAIHTCRLGSRSCGDRQINITSGWALHLSSLEIHMPAVGSTYCLHTDLAWLGGSLTMEDSRCASSRGIRFLGAVRQTAPASRFAVTLERNRFERGVAGAMREPIELLIGSGGTCGSTPAAPGTRVNALVRNNELFEVTGDAVYLIQCLDLAPADDRASDYVFTYNTITGAPTARVAYAFWNNSSNGHGPRWSVVNNLYYGFMGETYNGPVPDVAASNLRLDTSPFVDVATGDLRLAPGASPIDAADPGYVVTVDVAGDPRPIDGDASGSAEHDVGAREYAP